MVNNATRPIAYKCSSCGVKLESPAELGGKEDKCPLCNHICTVPMTKQQRAAQSGAGGVKGGGSRWRPALIGAAIGFLAAGLVALLVLVALLAMERISGKWATSATQAEQTEAAKLTAGRRATVLATWATQPAGAAGLAESQAKATIATLQDRNRELAASLAKLKVEGTALSAKLDRLQTENGALRTQVAILDKKNQVLANNVVALQAAALASVRRVVPLGQITGKCWGVGLSGDNITLQEADVTLYKRMDGKWRKVSSTESGEDGRYYFAALPPGRYRVVGNFTDFRQQSYSGRRKVRVPPGSKVHADINFGRLLFP